MRSMLMIFASFGSIVLIVALIAGAIIMIARLAFGGGLSRDAQRLQAEEARMVQEIHRGLAKMEERIEALETLLLERERKEHDT